MLHAVKNKAQVYFLVESSSSLLSEEGEEYRRLITLVNISQMICAKGGNFSGIPILPE